MWFSHIWEASEDGWSAGGQGRLKVIQVSWINSSVVFFKDFIYLNMGVIRI